MRAAYRDFASFRNIMVLLLAIVIVVVKYLG